MFDSEYDGDSRYNKNEKRNGYKEELKSVETYQAPDDANLHNIGSEKLKPFHLALRLPITIKEANMPPMTKVAA